MAKHYQFDAKFFVPLIAAFLAPFFTGWLTFERKWKKFRHLKIGIFSLLTTFLLTWCGFSFDLTVNNGSQIFLRGFAKASEMLLAGALIMIPAFILLVYLAEEKKKPAEEEEIDINEK